MTDAGEGSATINGGVDMTRRSSTGPLPRALFALAFGVCAALAASLSLAQEAASTAPASSSAAATAAKGAESFDTPEQAADAMVDAAERFDVAALGRLLGPGQNDVVLTGDDATDRERARAFATQGREQKRIYIEPQHSTRAVLLLGKQDWPFPVPIVKRHGKWSFDAAAGRVELLNRRIGGNELDAIAVCRGFVEAQYEYAFRRREGYDVHEYAQRVIATPGRQDGLAWQNPDGSWSGPVGEHIAHAIATGQFTKGEPYHGYYFKVLSKQGPAAPGGAMDYVVKGIMIGGFALAAAPAEYAKTGYKTFMVSQSGVVYEKDLGPGTLESFSKMESFNPDKSWTPVPE
jgi:hypothetical protein